jgi:hypothetical protein
MRDDPSLAATSHGTLAVHGKTAVAFPVGRGRSAARQPRRAHAEAPATPTIRRLFKTMQFRLPCPLSALLLLGATTAFADTVVAPPAWPAVKDSVSLAADPVRPLMLGALRVTLDGSTLAATRAAIGAGVLQRQGKGTDALDWLCYSVPDSVPRQRLWLTSSELSRGRIDAVVAADLPDGAAPSPQCPDLPARFRPVRFDDGMWLGGMSAELRKARAIPARNGPRFSSLFQGQAGDLAMVSSTVIEFSGGRVVSLHVAHSSQN